MKQQGDKISKMFLFNVRGNEMGAKTLEVSLSGVGTGFRLGRDAWSMVK